MATKESIKLEIDKLSEEQFQLVADFIEFLQFRVQKIDTSTKKRLSEFYGALPATQPYPGTEEIREIVGKSLAQEIINEQ
ncbi:MAG: hypothetical protein DSM106950_13780 [Stigonema ocellatum SAG 48.90 = DSM 106950]|nr:hypothetical protein [Stigonema ocellatum SAG 48.90 = DSM 106950]